jgi:fatty-acyl-CoA synthase
VIEAVVYGVTIPGTEGKAGMAALVVAPGFRLPALRDHCEASLPSYARPLFVRLCPAIEATGTFKLSKTTLAREGYAASPDPVWFDDKATGRFVPLDAALRQAIEAGELQV